jgi:hypothetical protein
VTASVSLAVVCLLVLAANWRFAFDVNVPSRYVPRLRNKATYPKAYVHGVTAFAAALGALVLGVPVPALLLILGLACVAWEFTQRGTVDRFDILAGWVGIVLACVVLTVARHGW